MNSFIVKTALLGLCSSSLLSAQNRGFRSSDAPSEWSVTLVQEHLESSGVFQGEVELKGNRVSFAPVPEGGSEFTLWAFRSGPTGLQEQLIDTEVVGAYLPEGDIWITTPDPYNAGIPRTRIDQGFTVNYDISGLNTSPDAPEAARRVLLDHKVTPAIGDPEDANLGEEIEAGQGFIDTNGVRSFQQQASPLIGADLFNSSGIETFSLFALPDGQVAELELSSAQVQVWPLSTGAFSGVDSSNTYTIAPPVSVNLENLYPDSETWVQVYPGPLAVGTEGQRLTETFVLIQNADKPRDAVMEFTTLDSVLDANGEWTLEVLHQTPFGIESIASTSINIDRDLKLRGSFQVLND